MKIVGKRQVAKPGLREPSSAEISASIENSRVSRLQIPKGVYRYRSHEQANEQMDRWHADAIARANQETNPSPFNP